jgi:hypothetical protein
VTGVAAFLVQHKIHQQIPADSWVSLFVLGGLFAGATTLLVVGADWALGGADAPSQQFVKRLASSRRIAPLLMRVKRVR